MDQTELFEHKTIEIEKGVSFGAKSGTIIEITKRDVEPDTIPFTRASAWPYAIWGRDNNQPQRIIDENMQETTSAAALDFKIKAHFGRGLYWYKESISNGKEIKTPMLVSDLPAEMQEFCYVNDLNNFQWMQVVNWEWFQWFPVQYICNASFNKIKWVRAQRTRNTRIGKRNLLTGEVPSFYLSAAWPKPISKKYYAEVPAFIREEPFHVANGIYKHEMPSVDKDYYPTPYWQSNMRWLEVAMKIPRWINSNIDNSINIKYHVEIPEQYFIDLYPEKNYTDTGGKAACLAARKAAEIAIKGEIDDCLAGADNASKIFYTKFAVDAQGNVRPGWKINELKNEIKDGAWLNADATAAARISSAHGVNPTLTSLVTGSNLNVGSGSDTREKFNVHMQLHTYLARQKTLEWYEIVQRANRWPANIKLGYRDITIESIAVAKTGFTIEHEQSPTAPNN